MATTGTTLMSWEQFEQLPDGDGFHREIIEGELQVLPPVKSGHTLVAHRAFNQVSDLNANGLGKAFIEAGYKLSERPATWVQPDVSFLLSARVLATDADDFFLGAPNLAVEIVSPSETGRKLQRKIDLMLEHGCQAVWAIHPLTKTVRVHLPGGTACTLGIGDNLDAAFLLPGWEFPIAKLFED